MHSRRQGDLGELAAMEWFASKGALIYFPIGHSPECDFIAEFEDRLQRVQVKTSTYWAKDRWSVTLCTRGGNQSWSVLVKRLDRSRLDFPSLGGAAGCRWAIPAQALQAASPVSLGGPKYSEFEVEAGRALPAREAHEP